jgi:hypothetical protein
MKNNYETRWLQPSETHFSKQLSDSLKTAVPNVLPVSEDEWIQSIARSEVAAVFQNDRLSAFLRITERSNDVIEIRSVRSIMGGIRNAIELAMADQRVQQKLPAMVVLETNHKMIELINSLGFQRFIDYAENQGLTECILKDTLANHLPRKGERLLFTKMQQIT